MTLCLEYEDKQRLWAALVQGATDRLFVPTDSPPPIGTVVSVRLSLPGQSLSSQLHGTVVGRRRRGDRVPGGAYLHFTHEELAACRGALGLSQGQEHASHGRRAPRVYRQLPLRFKQPRIDAPCAARNLSESGLQATCPLALFSGQRVEVSLTLDDGNVLPLCAEVVWVKPAEELAGLRFVDLLPGVTEKLASAIRRMLRASPPEAGCPMVVTGSNEQSLALLRQALGPGRAELFTASTGEEVLTLARRVRPAVVVLDVLLPSLDALDVCRRLHADPGLSEIPIVFHSALDPIRLQALADEAGATDYLGKPAEPEALARLLGTWLRAPGRG